MRIVTRPDFDGVVCAALLLKVLDIDTPTLWVQPSEMQKGLVPVNSSDVIANLPYNPKCGLWFDHHYSNEISTPFKGRFAIAPSAARVIYDYYKDRIPSSIEPLIVQTDKVDTADLTLDEILHPEKYPYIILSMTIFGRNATDIPYWNLLSNMLIDMDIKEILENEDVKSHISLAIENNLSYAGYLKEHTVEKSHVSITDFRSYANPPEGNRFLVYSLYPKSVVNVKIQYEKDGSVTIRVGHSILNNNCHVNVGKMLTQFNGGGHRGAGACKIDRHLGESVLKEIVDILVSNRPNE